LQLSDVADSLKCCSGIQTIHGQSHIYDVVYFPQQNPFLGVSVRTVSLTAGETTIVGYLKPNVRLESQRSGFIAAP